MESQPHNPEFRIDPKNIHPCTYFVFCGISSEKSNLQRQTFIHHLVVILTSNPLKYKMDNSTLVVFICIR